MWLPGSVAFNESVASFVGEEAALDYLEDKYGADSEPVRKELARRADRAVYLKLMHDVYAELDAVYTDDALSDEAKRARKSEILGSLPERAMHAGFSDPGRWSRWLAAEPWNNARLVQFRVYNKSPEHFAAVLQRTGDLKSFLDEMERIAASSDDPYAALEEAAEQPLRR